MNKYEVMCFGDSNTWGTVARKNISEPNLRYGRDVRWPCILQADLGEEYAVAEEGLGGRTSVYTADPDFPYKNGLVMFEGCIKTHHPLDLIIIMLGTNDIHLPYPLPEEELGEGIRKLVNIVKTHPEWGRNENTVPQILLIAPPWICPSAPDGRTEVYPRFFGEYGERLSHKFPAVWQKIAEETGCYFLNAQDYAVPDLNDGVHLTADSHVRLGHAVADMVRKIRKETTDMKREVKYFDGDIATPVMRFEKMLPSAQGMAVYGDTLFQLYHTGKCALYDLKTRSEKPLAFFPLGSSNDGIPDNNYLNHSNQCMFGTRHEGDNPLPILYVTSGYGIGEDENGFFYRCAAENITVEYHDDGTVKSAHSELLQTFSYRNDGIEDTPYEAPCWGCPAWFVDDKNGFVYIFSTRWRTKKEFMEFYDRNRFRITKLRMPGRDEGDLVVLTAKDIVDQFLMPFDILFTQGGMICGDKLFYTFGCGDAQENAYPNGLRVYDLTNKCLVASADLSHTCFAAEEIESAYFYHGELLVNTNAKPTGGIYSLGKAFAELL